MRLLTVFFVGLILTQDSQEAKGLKECAPFIAQLGSFDPDAREAARKAIEFRMKPYADALKKVDTPHAWIVLGVLKERAAKKPLLKLFRSDDKLIRAAAAEAFGGMELRSGSRSLAKLLQAEENPSVAFAAARALGRSKAKRELGKLIKEAERKKNKTLMLISMYGYHLIEDDIYLVQFLSGLEVEDQAFFKNSVIACINLPDAQDRLRKSWGERTTQRAPALTERFTKGEMDAETRGLLALLMLRSSLITYAEMMAFLTSKKEGLHEAAGKAAFAGDGTIRSVLLNEVVKQLKSTKEGSEEAKRLMALYQKATGFRAAEEKWTDTTKAYAEHWKKRTWSTIDADVPKVIDRGVAYLKKQQQDDGSWKYCTCGYSVYGRIDHTMGTTALVCYTLIKCDVPLKDPALAAGLKYIIDADWKDIEKKGTYTVSLVAIALSEALQHSKPKRDRKRRNTKVQDRVFVAKAQKRIGQCAKWLIAAQVRIKKGGYERGPWTYRKPTGPYWDNSNTQFALLGLLAARNIGIKIPKRTWHRAINHYLATQAKDGGWPYARSVDIKTGKEREYKIGSRSMSAAGICCFLICKASMKRIDTQKAAEGDKVIKAAMAKFEKTYPIPAPARNKAFGHVFSIFYDLYSIERAMMLGGFERIGKKNWYHDGALYIFYNQLHDGAWLDQTDTCFALLFLKKAYIAVASGK